MKIIYLIALFFLATSLGRFLPERQTAAPPDQPPRAVYCAPSFDPARAGRGNAPLLKGLGGFKYKITTRSAKAQRFFSQGLALMYGFNHGEALRSFYTAIQHDSACAMAWWGVAMVLGPNYNAALDPAVLQEINTAISNAVKYSTETTASEVALINAVALRFPSAPVDDMKPYYEAYANAMQVASLQHPGDGDIATLYADALMNLHPWDLYLKDGTPQPWTAAIIDALEVVLKKFPKHPGAIHLYIHATESSADPGRALPYADRLADIMPASGHLVHMPSHTYIRTGDYHKGVLVTEQAGIADSSYVAQCKVQGTYAIMYYPHNIHFLAACAFMEGNSRKAIDAAWHVSRKADRNALPTNPSVQHFYSIPYYVLVHMGKWNEILSLTHPGETLKYPAAVWHYARGMAYGATGNLAAANRELQALKNFAADESLKNQRIWEMNSVSDLVQIATKILEGELLCRQRQFEPAFKLFREAAVIEDGLVYQEPPDWFFSVRHTWGHWFAESGRYAEAEQVYREDMKVHPENGWALMGLHNSLKGQGKDTEANAVIDRFRKAWKWADIQITSSRKM